MRRPALSGLPFTALLVLTVGLSIKPSRGQPAPRPAVLRDGSAESVAMDPAGLGQAVDLYRQAIARDELRGVVLLVARRSTIVLHEAIGWRNKDQRLPMERDTLFRMASNTKPVVASALLRLEQEGRLKVDDRVGLHLAALDQGRWREVTLAHLLSHSSGLRITRIFLPFDDEEGRRLPRTLQAAVARFGPLGPKVAPGTTYSYNNAGYNTLGAVIEVAAGQSLGDYLRARFYAPLRMRDTQNHEDPSKLARMATVYRGTKGKDGRIAWKQGFTPGDPPDFPVIRASGGMISTSLDYARFLQMYLNGGEYDGVRVLDRETVAKALVPRHATGQEGSYGFGWMIAADGSYGHGGSDGTYAWVDPRRELFGLIFTQSPGGLNPRDEFKRLVAAAAR
jgi:CubicO group peptidase (beta-lactamase class C family)